MNFVCTAGLEATRLGTERWVAVLPSMITAPSWGRPDQGRFVLRASDRGNYIRFDRTSWRVTVGPRIFLPLRQALEVDSIRSLPAGHTPSGPSAVHDLLILPRLLACRALLSIPHSRRCLQA